MDELNVGIAAALVLILSIFKGHARQARQRYLENPMQGRRRVWGKHWWN